MSDHATTERNLPALRASLPTGNLDIMTLGDVLARSGYFSDVKDAAQAIVKVLAGRELGIPPIAAMTGIHIIKDRPTLSATLIAAKIMSSGRYSYRVKILSPTGCTLVIYRGSEQIGESPFSIEDAQAAGLLTGPNAHNWKHYPRNMLFARAISNAAKWYCPDLFLGAIYTPEELGAEVDPDTGVVTVLPPVASQEMAPNGSAGMDTGDVIGDESPPSDPPSRALPERTKVSTQATESPTQPGLMRSDQQVAAITRLAAKIGWDADKLYAWLKSEYNAATPDVLTFVQASRAITDLQRRPEAGG